MGRGASDGQAQRRGGGLVVERRTIDPGKWVGADEAKSEAIVSMRGSWPRRSGASARSRWPVKSSRCSSACSTRPPRPGSRGSSRRPWRTSSCRSTRSPTFIPFIGLTDDAGILGGGLFRRRRLRHARAPREGPRVDRARAPLGRRHSLNPFPGGAGLPARFFNSIQRAGRRAPPGKPHRFPLCSKRFGLIDRCDRVRAGSWRPDAPCIGLTNAPAGGISPLAGKLD